MPDYKLRIVVEGSDAGASRALDGVNKSLGETAATAKNASGGINGSLNSVVSNTKAASSSIQSSLKSTAEAFSNAGEKMRGMGKIMSLAVTTPIMGAVTAAVKMASDLNESASKVEVVFGKMSSSVMKWSETASTALGVSQQQALESVGTFGNLFKSMGLGEEPTLKMSESLVQLASDLASFNNLDPKEVLDKLRAGITGEAEPLKTLGVNINAAMIQAKALTMGLGKSNVDMVKVTISTQKLALAQFKASEALRLHGRNSKEYASAFISVETAQQAVSNALEGSAVELTAAEKAQAAYALIMEQTTTAQGDFARTSDGMANSMRIIKASVTDIGASLGSILLPYVNQAAAKIKDLLLSFDGLSDGTKKWIVFGALTAAAIGPLLIGLGTLSSAVGVLLPALGAMSGAFLPIAIGLGGLAAAYRLNIGGLRTFVDGGLERVKKSAPLAGRALTELVTRVRAIGTNTLVTGNGIRDFVGALTGSEETANNVTNGIIRLISQVDAAKKSFDGAGGGVNGFLSAISSFSGGAIKVDMSGLVTTVSWGDFIGMLDWKNYVFSLEWGNFLTGIDLSAKIATLQWGDFVGTLDWGDRVLTLGWGDYVATIDWGKYVDKLSWSNIVATFNGWRDYIEKLTWKTFITDAIDWGTWIVALDWKVFITALEWGSHIASFVWSEWIKPLVWSDTVQNLTWSDFVSGLVWASQLPALVWSDFITNLKWFGLVNKVSWGEWITKLDWGTIGLTAINWATWIPALAWNSVIAVLDWATYLTTLDWSTIVAKLTNWGTYVSTLNWGTFVAKLSSWTSFIGAFAWSSFVSKLNWPSDATLFTWSTWIDKLTWPDLTFSWSAFVEKIDWSSWMTALSWASFVVPLSWAAFVKAVDLSSYIPPFPSWSSLLNGILPTNFLGLGGGLQGPAAPAKGDPEVTFNIPKHAKGTDNFAGGWTWVGEKGPELLNLPAGSKIMSNQKSMGMIGKLADGNYAPMPTIFMPQSKTMTASPVNIANDAKMLARMTDSYNALKSIENLSRIGPDKIVQAQDKNQLKLQQSIDGMFQKAPGLMQTSEVTQDQLDMAKLGIPQNFADDWVRHLTDEVVNGVQWSDADITDAATRAGIDPSLPAKAILGMVKDQWNSGQFFADAAGNAKNTDLLNMDAIKQSILQQQQQAAGKENLMQLSAIFGGTAGDLTKQGQDIGGQARAGIVQGLSGTAGAGAAGSAPAVDLSTILLGGSSTGITPEAVAPLAASFVSAFATALTGSKDDKDKGGIDFGAAIVAALTASLGNSDALAGVGQAILQKITESWKTIKDVDFIGGMAAAMALQIDTQGSIDALKNVGAKIAQLIKKGIDDYFKDAALADSISNSVSSTTSTSTPTIPGQNAGGTSFWKGGLSWVGERGAELVNLPRGAQVFNNGQSMAMAGAGGGGDIHIHATINTPIDVEKLAYRVSQIQQKRGR